MERLLTRIVETRHGLIVGSLIVLVLLALVLLFSRIQSALSLSGVDLLVWAGILIDLGILGLIGWEDFGAPFLSRPRPIIEAVKLTPPRNSTETLDVMGVSIRLFETTSVELWMSIRNDGRTPVRRMRARAKFALVPPPLDAPPEQRPLGITGPQWEERIRQVREFRQNMFRQMADSMFGRPLPFTKTPSGTAAFPWFELGSVSRYETDLSAGNDEAAVRLFALYRLGRSALMELERSGRIKFGNTIPSPAPAPPPGGPSAQSGEAAQPPALAPAGGRPPPSWQMNPPKVVATQIGTSSGIAINPQTGQSLGDFVVKFWITADNLRGDCSELFHVEIVGVDDLVCTPVPRKSPDRARYEALLVGSDMAG